MTFDLSVSYSVVSMAALSVVALHEMLRYSVDIVPFYGVDDDCLGDVTHFICLSGDELVRALWYLGLASHSGYVLYH